MILPVNFNNQLFMKTYKVYNIILYNMLSSKLMSINAFCFQQIPNDAFCLCRMTLVVVRISAK